MFLTSAGHKKASVIRLRYSHLVGNVHAEEKVVLVLSNGCDIAGPDLQLVPWQLSLALMEKIKCIPHAQLAGR